MKRILSIDYEPAVLQCLGKLLMRKGYELLLANNPDKGLQIFKDDTKINLVLLDIMMPHKDGFQVYREMQSVRHVPALFVTAYPRAFNAESKEMEEMWRKDFADGMTDIIYKPFDFSTLIEKVESLIGPAGD